MTHTRFLILLSSLIVTSPCLGWKFLPKFSLSPAEQSQNISEYWSDNAASFSGMFDDDRVTQPQFNPNDKVHGFTDIVGGVPQEVETIIDSLKNPEKYRKAGIKVPNAILFTGEPGTGKTSTARALAQEIGGDFLSFCGADFVEIWVGNGARKVRAAFAQARALAARTKKKVFLFIYEIDAIGKRGGDGYQNSEVQQTINALLKEISGIEDDSSVIVLAATNFVSNIDPALMRSGRFTVIEIPMPDAEKRESILKHYCRNKKLAADVDLSKFAEHTNNFSPADLEELVNQASSSALLEKTKELTLKQFIHAIKFIWRDRKNQGERNTSINLDALDIAFQEEKTEEKPHGLGFHGLAGEIEPEILNVVRYLQHPEEYKYYGVNEPKGILMVGLPGTGKTSLARALAQEANVEFIVAKGSEFVEIYVGNGAKRVRELFDKARKKAGAKKIIFIDEIDAIGSRDGMSHQEARQTVTELLAQMEGFEQDDSIMVIAATNCPQNLDPALLRPGRFDVTIEVPLPTLDKRIAILEFYCAHKPMDADIDYNDIAKVTEGFTPADLKNLVNEAAKAAMQSNEGRTITQVHFLLALKKLGVQQKIKEDNKVTSYIPPYLQQ